MVGSQAGDGLLTTDRSRAALDFAHGLLSRDGDAGPGLDALAGELVAAYAARAGGVSDLESGLPLVLHRAGDDTAFPEVFPWQTDPDLLSRVRQSPDAVTVGGEGETFLVAAVAPLNGGWLLWIADAPRGDWTAAEKAALVLVAQLIARRLNAGCESGLWEKQLGRWGRQQSLEQAAALTRRLAHDYGNVLTGILGFSELALGQQAHSASALNRFITEIYRSAQAGAQMTHQLQLFSRRHAVSHRSAALAPLLGEEEGRLRSAGGDAVRWEWDVAAGLPPVGIDQEALRQVLGAVFDNAREAVAGGGRVTVTARSVLLSEADCLNHYGSLRPGAHVEVCVRDTGPGLGEAARRLFVEPFYTSKVRRRGFGLAVAYGLLSAHRGGLSLANGSPRGAVVRVLLPVAATPAVPVSVPAAAAAAPPRGEKVLVVDDDPMILQFVSTTLEQAGYRVKAVGSADEALDSYAAAGADPFRLVLSDVVMPRVNGVDLVRRLLTRDAAARVLFMSGQVSPDFARADFAEHQFDLLSKPFRPEGLLRAVRGALDRVHRKA